jgi:hypothetical protein
VAGESQVAAAEGSPAAMGLLSADCLARVDKLGLE